MLLSALPLLAAALVLAAEAPGPGPAPRPNHLGLAAGTIPVAFAGSAQALGVGIDHALLLIDGDERGSNPSPRPGGADARVVIVFELPAATTFDEFVVPNVLETPSPAQTFFKNVEVAGSDSGAEGPFQVLARAALETHTKPGLTTTIPVTAKRAVRWVRVTLAGGIDVRLDKTFFEFSELRGHGTQVPVPMSSAFTGTWKGRGLTLQLRQEGAVVTGCYDAEGDLRGTVTGNLLRATGRTRKAGIPSVFLFAAGADGGLVGVRSTNGAPFRLYSASPAANAVIECPEPPAQALGCGSIIHGINFDFDSATIRPESGPLLDALYTGLQASNTAAVTVVGHTSNEGTDTYNAALSRRRAESVVAALVQRGLDRARIAADGRGEQQPIADNASEAGRSLNRRVEIACR